VVMAAALSNFRLTGGLYAFLSNSLFSKRERVLRDTPTSRERAVTLTAPGPAMR